MSRSYLKWVGGKARSVQSIVPKFPKKYNVYHEPFFGSGVVYFTVNPERSRVSDYNFSLVETHVQVALRLDRVKAALQEMDNTSEDYYALREEYNNYILNGPDHHDLARQAAIFIYLNRCGFNGLYRVNKSGGFNVPYGKRKNQPHHDIFEVLEECSEKLKRTTIFTQDFRRALSHCEEGDFVYLDPPYLEELEGSFTSYNKNGFTPYDHEELANELDVLDQKGVKFAMSNSDTSATHLIYGVNPKRKGDKWKCHKIYTTRSVSRSASGRGIHRELLITNY